VAPGDVVHVGVFWEEAGLRLSLVVVDGTLTPPPSLVAGGVPWLSEPEDDFAEEEAVVEPVEPITTPVIVQAPGNDAVLDELRRLRVEFRDMQRGITALHSAMARVGSASAPPRRAPDPERVTRLERELHTAERSLQELRTAKAAAERSRVEADRARVDAEKKVRALEARVGGQPRDEGRAARGTFEYWIRHEVRLAWVARVPAGEKVALPLGPFGVGPSFEQDLAALTDDQFDKTMRAIVDVLTGRAASLDSREVHRLRMSDAGGSPTSYARPTVPTRIGALLSAILLVRDGCTTGGWAMVGSSLRGCVSMMLWGCRGRDRDSLRGVLDVRGRAEMQRLV